MASNFHVPSWQSNVASRILDQERAVDGDVAKYQMLALQAA